MHFFCRNARLHKVKSQSLSRLTLGTWSSFLKWLEVLSEFTMVKPSIRLKSSLKWSATTWPSSLSHISLSSTVDPVLVLLTRQGSYLSSDLPTYVYFSPVLALSFVKPFKKTILMRDMSYSKQFLLYNSYLFMNIIVFDGSVKIIIYSTLLYSIVGSHWVRCCLWFLY